MVLFYKLIYTLVAMTLSLSASRFAQSAETNPPNQSIDPHHSRGLYPVLFLDTEFGLSQLQVTQPNEINKSGTFTGLRASARYNYQHFAVEGSAGYFLLNLTGQEGRIAQSAAASGLYMDAGALWLVGNTWSFGGKARWLFGSKSDLGPVDESKSYNILESVDAYYLPQDYSGWRVGLHFQQDATITGRKLTSALISLGYGISTAPERSETVESIPPPSPTSVPKSSSKPKASSPLETKIAIVEPPTDSFTFRPYATQLDTPTEKLLTPVIKFLQNHPDIHLRIEGHSDSSGDPKQNLDLSKMRAQMIRDYLITHGIDPDRLSFLGLGSRAPKHTNDTEEGRAANRRAEFIWIYPEV